MDAVGDGLTVQRSKPAPDIFLWVAGALGTRPVEAVAIEDSQVGVQAASTAGMLVIGVGQDILDAGADLKINNLTEIAVAELFKLIDRR
jgi:beta-phosphoglucomutase-like phosphatase (HAD superfamily)